MIYIYARRAGSDFTCTRDGLPLGSLTELGEAGFVLAMAVPHTMQLFVAFLK